MNNKAFYRNFIIIYLVVSMLIAAGNQFKLPFLHPNIWSIQFYFLVITLLTHFISSKGLKKVTEFHIFYMASMGIRFLLSLFFIFVNLWFSKDGHIVFVIDFFILYFLYTSFEIYFLLTNLRPDSENDGTVHN